MTYRFEIPTGLPIGKNAKEQARFRRQFAWALEVHIARFKGYQRIGIGWVWFLNESPRPVTAQKGHFRSVWLIGSYVSRQVQKIVPRAELYSIGERVSIRPGEQMVCFTLEIS